MRYTLAQKSLTALRGSDLAAFVKEREAQGRSSHTITRDIALISRLYEIAKANWGMEGLNNPTKSIIKLKLPLDELGDWKKAKKTGCWKNLPKIFRMS
jgi:hypothetical protein